MEKVSISEKLLVFDKYWQSKNVGEYNNQYVKLAKLKGEFGWHHHKEEDEFYLILRGKMIIRLGNKRDITLNEGEFFIVPAGTEHNIIAEEEAQVLMFEAKSTLNTEKGEPDKPETVQKP